MPYTGKQSRNLRGVSPLFVRAECQCLACLKYAFSAHDFLGRIRYIFVSQQINKSMNATGIQGTKILAYSYPFVVLLSLPEIANSGYWFCWYVVETINHSSLGRTMETYVGLGVIFMIVVYIFFLTVGLIIFILSIWLFVKALKVSKGLMNWLEKSRKSIVFTNFIYATFIACAFFLCNYCNLPGRSVEQRHSRAEGVKVECTEGLGRKSIKILDSFIVPYYLLSIYFFTRPRTRERFE